MNTPESETIQLVFVNTSGRRVVLQMPEPIAEKLLLQLQELLAKKIQKNEVRP